MVFSSSALALALFVFTLSNVACQEEGMQIMKHRNSMMHSIYNAYMNTSVPSHGRGLTPVIAELYDSYMPLTWLSTDSRFLLVEIASSVRDAEANLRPHLEDGYDFQTTACGLWTCSGFLDITLLEKVEASSIVHSIVPSLSMAQAFNGSGTIVNQALYALQVDRVYETYPHLNGTGMKIGVLSNSFNMSTTAVSNLSSDIRSGNLPDMSRIQILKDAVTATGASDEGRAILQIIHDLVPGAMLYFRTGSLGSNDLVAGIKELADAGCHVIIDTMRNIIQPFFQEGILSQAASDVVRKKGIAYFSSAGNYARSSWEGFFLNSGRSIPISSFSSSEGPHVCHNFGDPNNVRLSQRITISSNGLFIFNWDEPSFTASGPPGSRNDLDIVFVHVKNNTIANGSGSKNINGDPSEVINLNAGEYDLYIIYWTNSATPPNFMKWIWFGGGTIVANPPAIASTITGTANSPYTAGVGAASVLQRFGQLKMQPFSSVGGTPLLFEQNGTRKAKPLVLQQPRFTGTDASLNTFLGLPPVYGWTSNGYLAFGTSVAAANVGAIALMMLQAKPSLKPLDLYRILEETAIDMNEPGFDFESGFGLVDAKAAIDKVLDQPDSFAEQYCTFTTHESCASNDDYACAWNPDLTVKSVAICTEHNKDGLHFHNSCVDVNELAAFGVGNVSPLDNRVIFKCGCCDAMHLPSGSSIKGPLEKFCYDDALCSPGDDAWEPCDAKRSKDGKRVETIMVKACVNGKDRCVDPYDKFKPGSDKCGPCVAQI